MIHLKAIYIPKEIKKEDIEDFVRAELLFLYDQEDNPFADVDNFTCLHPRKVQTFVKNTFLKLQKAQGGILVHLFDDYESDKQFSQFQEEMAKILNHPGTVITTYSLSPDELPSYRFKRKKTVDWRKTLRDYLSKRSK